MRLCLNARFLARLYQNERFSASMAMTDVNQD